MVSLRTALIIQEHGADVAVGTDKNTGKYAFEIYSIIRERYRPHLTSKGIYDSEEIAEGKGKELLEDIKALDLDKKRKELSGLIGDVGPIVEKIVDASIK